jgi:hypothetical protein
VAGRQVNSARLQRGLAMFNLVSQRDIVERNLATQTTIFVNIITIYATLFPVIAIYPKKSLYQLTSNHIPRLCDDYLFPNLVLP